MDLFLKNSIPYRKRSPSDFFLDNGLALLYGFLTKSGINVEVQDWANIENYENITNKNVAIQVSDLLNKGKTNSQGYIDKQIRLDQYIKKRMHDKNLSLGKYLYDKSVKVFGEKTFFGDSWINSKELFTIIKEYSPETIIVAGGPQVSVWRELIFNQSNVDFFVFGEGEYTLAKIVFIRSKHKNKQSAIKEIIDQAERGLIENLMFRDQKGVIRKTNNSLVNANNKVIPNYNFLPKKKGLISINSGKANIHVLIDSLGCPWNKCRQCDHKHIYEKYYERDPEFVIAEIKEMIKQGVGIFRYAGSGATLNHQLNISRSIIKEGLKIKFSSFMRASPEARKNYSKLIESYKILIESGLTCVGMGGESGNDTINLIFNKGVTSDDVKYSHQALIEAGESFWGCPSIMYYT